MKRILTALLFIMPLILFLGFYFLDRHTFLCPIDYAHEIIIRYDSRGDGEFGAKRSGNRTHEGIDLLADIGAPVKAARSGIVVLSRVIENKDRKTGSGNYIIIAHPGGTRTTYAHLTEVYAGKNQLIRQGQVIGTVGKTGNANYPDILPHLHFEVREGAVPRDPQGYFK